MSVANGRQVGLFFTKEVLDSSSSSLVVSSESMEQVTRELDQLKEVCVVWCTCVLCMNVCVC